MGASLAVAMTRKNAIFASLVRGTRRSCPAPRRPGRSQRWHLSRGNAGRHLRSRNYYRERRALPKGALDVDLGAALVNDVFDDEQTQIGTTGGSFRHQRLLREQVRALLLVESGTIVL